jgi:GTPase SAR1 family protein
MSGLALRSAFPDRHMKSIQYIIRTYDRHVGWVDFNCYHRPRALTTPAIKQLNADASAYCNLGHKTGCPMTTPTSKSGLGNEVLDFLKTLWADVKDHVLNEAWAKIQLEIKKAQKRFSGETIAVLGPPAAGKTTFIKVLQNPNATANELATYNKTELESHNEINVDFKLAVESSQQVRFRFKVRKNSDVGGEQYIRDQHWPKVIKDAAVIIYLVEGPRLLKDDAASYKERILSDFAWILDNSQLLRENFAIVIGFNKVDQLCDRKGYKPFVQNHAGLLDGLKSSITEQWPDHLSGNIKGGIFLSLVDPGLRAFTLNGLISCFVGDELMKFFKQSK